MADPFPEYSDGIRLLRSCVIGNPTATVDTELFRHRDVGIRTLVYHKLIGDQIDHVRGIMGTGKTALLLLLLRFFSTPAGRESHTIVAPVVAPGSRPIVSYLTQEMQPLTEEDLESFWRLYLLAIAGYELRANKERPEFINASSSIDALSREADRLFKGADPLRRVLSFVRSVRVEPTLSFPATADALHVKVHLRMAERPTRRGSLLLVERVCQPLAARRAIEDLESSVLDLLTRTGVRLWLLFDELDMCFRPRHSPLEKRALRSLLRAAHFMSSPNLRVKLFIRDDMLHDITQNGFAGYEHFAARMSQPLCWSEDDIMLLILKRLFSSDFVASRLAVDRQRLESSDNYRQELFYRVFPARMQEGKSGQESFKWLYHHSRDGNSVVAPRDVIDMVEEARIKQIELIERGRTTLAFSICKEALKNGFAAMSERKCVRYLEGEFPEFRAAIERLRGGKSRLEQTAIRKLYGREWRRTAKELERIGLLEYHPTSSSYTIPYIFRPGLGVKRGTVK